MVPARKAKNLELQVSRRRIEGGRPPGVVLGIDFRPVPPRKSERKGPFAHFVELVARKNCITRLRTLSAPPSPLAHLSTLRLPLLRVDRT